MKTILEFDGHEERYDMLLAVNAPLLLAALYDADNLLRSYEKYSNGTLKEAENAIDDARTVLNEARERVEL